MGYIKSKDRVKTAGAEGDDPDVAPLGAHNPRVHKLCIKCRLWKSREKCFGAHESSSDGLQSICFKCKNKRNNEKRNNNVVARIRHHTATRCITQLGKLKPSGFTTNIEDYLGYRIKTLVRHLRADLRAREGEGRSLLEALQEGYHIDHITPLHSYQVITPGGEVDWDAFKACWRVENLRAIPAAENLAKGGKFLAN